MAKPIPKSKSKKSKPTEAALRRAQEVADLIDRSRTQTKSTKKVPQAEFHWDCEYCSSYGMFTLPKDFAQAPVSFQIALGIHRTVNPKCKFTGNVRMTARPDSQPGVQITLA